VGCCTPEGYRTVFTTRTAARDARRYRRKGLSGTARWLAGRLEADGVRDRSLLEVGGGVGGLQIDLLKAGAATAVNVEIADTYERAAHELLAESGLEARAERIVADFAERPDAAAGADVVILHRVICCHPDAAGLTTAACGHARDRVAITIPRTTWWIRLGFATMNRWLRLRRIPFAVYVHPPAMVVGLAHSLGFRTAHQERGILWESVILQRRAPA
jgi:magnesium-protoporphyrin O-methyltransferase